MLGVRAAKGSTAVTPSSGEDSAATLGISTVELD
jgi:hypothetical protein